MYVVDHARWSKHDESWTKARPLLLDVFGYSNEDVDNFIIVQDKFWFPPFAINITKEQARLIMQPFLDNELNVFCMIYDDITLKPIDFCYSGKDLGIVRQKPKHHYYDKPILDLSQRVDPLNPPTFDSSWVNLSILGGNSNAFKQAPTITCPYCKSTNCKKITATAKAVNIALFGIFGNKRRHQWHCEKCGSDF